MALSNRERVGRGLEILAEGLAPFVDRLMSAAAPPGRDWLTLLKDREEQNVARQGGGPLRLSKSDPQLLLKVITDHRSTFLDELTHTGMRYASELRDTRNVWAHNGVFDSDDAYRALDTMRLLLRTIDAKDAEERIRAVRDDQREAAHDKRLRNRARYASPVALPVAGQAGEERMPSWREVMTPHTDVRTGDFNAAEFAADLDEVAKGRSESEEYAEPIPFFQRTHLTEGLREVLVHAARRLNGDMNAEPVFNLQTNFGGGKTHTMLALWHLYDPKIGKLADYPEPVVELLNGTPRKGGVRRVALVGNKFDFDKPSEKDDGTRVKTLWGELGWQLGGRHGYEKVAGADEAGTPPGESLRNLLEAYAPCVILIDEWVAYARNLYGRTDLPAGPFDAQFSFAQNLTEYAKAVQGVAVLISIPASAGGSEQHADEQEVGGIGGEVALERLQRVVHRIARPWRTASSHEAFEIVRRRLFEEPDARGRRERDLIARTMVRFYRENASEFPKHVCESAYEDEIKAAYPIHPELFQRLYDDWSTLERFQRTRGVLRLMSAVIHRLWRDNDPAPLIMPGTMPISDEQVHSELTHYLGDAWKPIIDKDVAGVGSTPEQVDKSRKALDKHYVTSRIARAAFIGSAATHGTTARKGIERKQVWLGTALPGDIVGNFGTAIHLLSEQTTYFYADGTSYWYDTQASVNRLARDRAEELRGQPEEIYAEIVKRLEGREVGRKGSFARVHAAPEATKDIPDLADVRLVIVHPRRPHSGQNGDSPARGFALDAVESRGNVPRTNQNMLVFAVAERELLGYLMDAVRDYLAWRSIVNDKEVSLGKDQEKMAKKRLDTAGDTVTRRLIAAYNTVLFPVWEKGRVGMRGVTLDEDGDHIAERVSVKLRHEDQLRVVHRFRLIKLDLEERLPTVWKKGQVSVGDLWAYYCRFPYLPRLRNRQVLEDGILHMFESEITGDVEGFAVAHGMDERTGRYIDLAIPNTGEVPGQITDATLLVDLGQAKAQRAEEEAERRNASASTGGTPTVTSRVTPMPELEEDAARADQADPAPKNTRFWGSHKVDPERFARDLNRLSKDLLALLSGPDGVELDVRVEIEARRADGFPDDTVMKVMENLGHLKVDGRFENL